MHTWHYILLMSLPVITDVLTHFQLSFPVNWSPNAVLTVVCVWWAPCSGSSALTGITTTANTVKINLQVAASRTRTPRLSWEVDDSKMSKSSCHVTDQTLVDISSHSKGPPTACDLQLCFHLCRKWNLLKIGFCMLQETAVMSLSIWQENWELQYVRKHY